MDIFDSIIEALEVEKELGTRTMEMDRALLLPGTGGRPKAAVVKAAVAAAMPRPKELVAAVPRPKEVVAATAEGEKRKVAFFTGTALSAGGDELLGKMIAAMNLSRDEVYVNEMKPAKVNILMGALAARMLVPNRRLAVGSSLLWNRVETYVTYSPDFILTHFEPDSKGMNDAKRAVWNLLKMIMEKSL